MALSYATRLAPSQSASVTSSAFVTGSLTTTAGSLILAQITLRPTGAQTTGIAHVTGESSAVISNMTFLQGGGSVPLVEWYSFVGVGGTDASPNFTCTFQSSGTISVASDVGVAFWEITGASSLTVLQSASVLDATNATGTVTLAGAVIAGNECFYMARWNDDTDDATPGTGWTEQNDAGVSSFDRFYAQYHPSPSGAQNGQVSAIASQSIDSCIVEINNPSARGGGFGAIPIK